MREVRSRAAQRWLAIGLTAALIAMVFEEGSSPAMREPGFPPIFLTVWAGLWALVRSARSNTPPAPDAVSLSPAIPRAGGVIVAMAACALGYLGIQDWRATRSAFQAARDIEAGQFQSAIREADFAGANILAPFRKLSARILAVEARARDFAHTLEATEGPPSVDVMEAAQEAMSKLDKLSRAAPRFLGVTRLAWQISWNQMAADRLLGHDADAAEHFGRYVNYLEQHRKDEPFQIELVERLWRDKPQAAAIDRIEWLRSLIRREVMDSRFFALVQSFGRTPGSRTVLDGLLDVAMQDHARSPAQWNDRLSPETLRIAALARDWSDQSAEAVKLAALADEMYAKAGGRLFEAHAAAVHELVRYQFHDNPTAGTDQQLEELARSRTILAGPTPATDPLPGGPGVTRLRILLAAGRQSEAEAQLRVLNPEDPAPMPHQLARAYTDLAAVFATSRQHADLPLLWAKRAIELDPDHLDAYSLEVRIFLQKADDVRALSAARRYIDVSPESEDAFEFLRQAEVRWPNSTIWADLRRQYPDFPASPDRDEPATTTGKATEEPPDR